MKIEIDDTQLIDRIVNKVVQRIKPLLNGSNNSKGDELMDVKGLTDYLKVKESWVYDKIYKREIPFYKVGKFPRFRRKDVDLWLNNPYHPNLSNYNINHNGKRGVI